MPTPRRCGSFRPCATATGVSGSGPGSSARGGPARSGLSMPGAGPIGPTWAAGQPGCTPSDCAAPRCARSWRGSVVTPARPRRPDRLRRTALAILTRDTATLHVGWPRGSILVDAVLGDFPASNAVYCGLALDDPAPSLDALQAVGFRLVRLGSALTAWLWGRSFEETRRGLQVLGSQLARLVSAGDGVGSRERSSMTASQGG